ncbi:MAG: hypothetical protein AAGF20_10925 [Pseudomonadota bacterium]
MTQETETGANTHRPSETLKRLQEARKRGQALSWGGFILALFWWAAAFGGSVAGLGWSQIEAASTPLLIAGTTALLLPGLMLVLAGFLAREQARATAANAIVLEAAERLLLPMEHHAGAAGAFAEDMASASQAVDRSMNHALAAMRAMAVEIGDERQRLEAVTYASADNARDLAGRLQTERVSLETLAKELREQTDVLNIAIPRQAQMMVASAKAAADEVKESEAALENRLGSLDQTGRTLAQKIAAMDSLATEAGERNETLLFAIARMEEKLEHSRKTVEAASRAGELAAAAATTTGDRLSESVRSALEGARMASQDIQRQSLDASESAARALAELKRIGEEAASAVRAAGLAARAEMDIADRYGVAPASALQPPVIKAPRTDVAEGDIFDDGPETAQAVAPPAEDRSPLDPKTARPVAADLEDAPTPTREHTQSEETAEPSGLAPASKDHPSLPATGPEDDLFEVTANRIAAAYAKPDRASGDAPGDGKIAATAPKAQRGNQTDETATIVALKETQQTRAVPSVMDTRQTETETDSRRTSPAKASLSDIIAELEREDRPTPDRETTAEALILRLEDSGIPLTEIFRQKDKKKIAVAARKGADQRRKAIQQQAARQVERVRQRLYGDRDLMMLARDFLALEEPDALQTLETAHNSKKTAGARLSAFLLLDAALV